MSVWQVIGVSWFGVAKLTLERHYPDLAEKFFANMTVLEGPQAAVAVTMFMERIAALEDANGGYGPDAAAARALLEERGLRANVIAQARTLIEQLGTFQVPDATLLAQDADEQAAESAMWAWYIEWAGIARHAIRDRRLLRALGFLRTRRGAVDEVDDAEDGVAPTVVPAANGGVPAAPRVPVAGSVDVTSNATTSTGMIPAPQLPAAAPAAAASAAPSGSVERAA